MEREWVVLSRSEIRKLSLPDAAWGTAAPAEEAAALCTGNGRVYAALSEALFALDAHSLLPSAVFAGVPGVRSLLLSGDGTRLYALCSDADSVLMLSAVTGEAQILCRAGAHPPFMMLDQADERLIIAGGREPALVMLCARSLQMRGRIAMPGPVCCAAVRKDTAAALCMTESLDTLLVISDACGNARRMRRFSGFPGALLLLDGVVLAAVQGCIHLVSTESLRLLRSIPVPGCAERMNVMDGALVFLDRLSETLYLLRGGCVIRLASDIRDFAPLERIRRG